MDNKKTLFGILIGLILSFVIFSSILVIPSVFAETGDNNVTSPTNISNYSIGDTMTITCGIDQSNGGHIRNVTVWYNATSLSYGSPAMGTVLIANITNTSANQSIWTATYTINSTIGTDSTDYGIWCEGFNVSNGYVVNTTANANITIDQTAPAVTVLTAYRNATEMKSTSTLILNVSVSDAIAGIRDNSYCFFDINGTNQTFAITKHNSTFGWCNASRLNLTNLGDGARDIKIYVNDSANSMRLNTSVYVLADSTAPSASASCTESSVVVGSSFACTCGGTDPTAGINASFTTAGTTVTSPTAGSFSYSCSVTDNAGNSASNSFAYTVIDDGGTTSSGSSSGGSSGSSGSVSSVKSNIFTTVTPEKTSVMKSFSAGIGIKEIQIEVNNEVKNLKMVVSKYDGKPAAVSTEKAGKVYQYIQIDAQNVGTDLKKATVTTKVEKSWVTDNSLEKDNLALFKFNEETEVWDELTTTFDSEDDTYYYFNSELTSFSYFAISEKVVEEEESSGIGTILSDAFPDDVSEAIKGTSKWLWVVIAIIIVGIAYGVVSRRKK